jgi:hypothetical protein
VKGLRKRERESWIGRKKRRKKGEKVNMRAEEERKRKLENEEGKRTKKGKTENGWE